MNNTFHSKAIIQEAPNTFKVADVEVGEPGPHEVRLKMKWATFSKEDSIANTNIFDNKFPLVGGYDGLAEVHKVGEGVTDFHAGDLVSVFLVPQHQSVTKDSKTNISAEFSRKIKEHSLSSADKSGVSLKEGNAIGKFFGLGTWSGFTIVDEANIAKVLDANIPPPILASLGYALSTGLNASHKVVNVEEGSNTVVFGTNSIGLLVAYELLNGNKAKKVVVVGSDQHVLEFLEKKGAVIVHVQDTDEFASIKERLLKIEGDGYDYTFECVDFNRYATIGLEICHKGWGRCCLLSQGKEKGKKIETRPFQVVTGRRWIGSFIGNTKAKLDIGDLESKVKNEKITEYLEQIFNKVNIVTVEEFPSKWEGLTKHSSERVIIKFD